ncbi:glycosyl hydrolase family 28 protein [Bacteroides sp. KFT8]|uniref:glycosyl hydrolase family 28 protein n=1 Tax=Bacteroides sp. KFT8 TaxID=2025659 RepID=UPI000C03B39E|nr:glycosyl hydrolase family 28 protein [Bacteroides sp. KFT8]
MNILRVLSGRRKWLLAVSVAFSTIVSAQLVTYPEGVDTGMSHNDDYTVRVRVPGGEWKDLFEYNVNVDMDKVQSASMVQFDMGSPVEVMMKKNNGLIQDVQIRPLAKGIRHTVNRNAILFTLEKPQYLSVEFNGDRLHNLHLFANPLETEIYTENNEKVMYFGPGVHRPQDVPNNQIQIPSNTTVYLAPGAVVKAKLLVDKAENVRIMGRGILDHPIRGIEVTHSKNVLIDGITVVNPDHYTVFGGESNGLTIKNLKSFSCKGWSDGIDMMCCNEVLIDNVFMRNSDDCIAIYAHRWSYYGGSKNVILQNSVLWADIAHPINIGGHGNAACEKGETIENITIRNIDILEHDEDDPPYQGCMAIDCGDKNLVRKVLFEDIRVESIQEGRLFHVNVRFNPKYDKQPGRGIEDITFRNIIYNGIGESPSLLQGFDKERGVKNVTFENVVINGIRMKNTDDFITNEFVKGIKVK